MMELIFTIFLYSRYILNKEQHHHVPSTALIVTYRFTFDQYKRHSTMLITYQQKDHMIESS